MKQIQRDIFYSVSYDKPNFISSDFSKFESGNTYEILEACPERLTRMLSKEWLSLVLNTGAEEAEGVYKSNGKTLLTKEE